MAMVTKKLTSRIDLAKYFNECGYKKGAEVGVADGRYSLILCQNIPGLKLLCVDPYLAYAGNSQDGSQANQDRCRVIAIERLKNYDAKFIYKMSDEAQYDIQDNSLDFVYIDANHSFDYIMVDIIQWSRKVRVGGIVSGHDYWNIRDFGVYDAVNEYTSTHRYKLEVIEGEQSRRLSQAAPNWWFIKSH